MLLGTGHHPLDEGQDTRIVRPNRRDIVPKDELERHAERIRKMGVGRFTDHDDRVRLQPRVQAGQLFHRAAQIPLQQHEACLVDQPRRQRQGQQCPAQPGEPNGSDPASGSGRSDDRLGGINHQHRDHDGHVAPHGIDVIRRVEDIVDVLKRGQTPNGQEQPQAIQRFPQQNLGQAKRRQEQTQRRQVPADPHPVLTVQDGELAAGRPARRIPNRLEDGTQKVGIGTEANDQNSQCPAPPGGMGHLIHPAVCAS